MRIAMRISRLEQSCNNNGDIQAFIALERGCSEITKRVLSRCAVNNLPHQEAPTEKDILRGAMKLHQKYGTIATYNEALKNFVFPPKTQEIIDRHNAARQRAIVYGKDSSR